MSGANHLPIKVINIKKLQFIQVCWLGYFIQALFYGARAEKPPFSPKSKRIYVALAAT